MKRKSKEDIINLALVHGASSKRANELAENYNREHSDHTPTPWYKSEDSLGIASIHHDSSKEFEPTFTIADRVNKQDAAFIVRAVNSHESLLGILKELVKSSDFEFVERSLRDKVDAIIAQAEKGI